MNKNVTLVTIDSVATELTALAVRDTLGQIEPADYIHADFGDGFGSTLWYRLVNKIPTSHVLVIQYDGWVLDGGLWNNDWLRYDYVGAIWPWHRKFRVGNGGFSLRSRRLLEFLAEHKSEFPLDEPEDDCLCRKHRADLEGLGFTWAPDDVARQFAFEREVGSRTFGFHGLYNFDKVLSRGGLLERVWMANPYVRAKPEWTELMTSTVKSLATLHA